MSDTKTLIENNSIPVTESGCWIWLGSINSHGYARHKGIGAMHRYSYRIYRGDIPEGMFVCHSCDIPACVNPAHLWLGTQFDNMRDMAAKGRHAKRTKAARAEWSRRKLTNEQVVEIRTELAAGIKQRAIAKKFGISQSEVSFINTRRNWGFIP